MGAACTSLAFPYDLRVEENDAASGGYLSSAPGSEPHTALSSQEYDASTLLYGPTPPQTGPSTAATSPRTSLLSRPGGETTMYGSGVGPFRPPPPPSSQSTPQQPTTSHARKLHERTPPPTLVVLPSGRATRVRTVVETGRTASSASGSVVPVSPVSPANAHSSRPPTVPTRDRERERDRDEQPISPDGLTTRVTNNVSPLASRLALSRRALHALHSSESSLSFSEQEAVSPSDPLSPPATTQHPLQRSVTLRRESPDSALRQLQQQQQLHQRARSHELALSTPHRSASLQPGVPRLSIAVNRPPTVPVRAAQSLASPKSIGETDSGPPSLNPSPRPARSQHNAVGHDATSRRILLHPPIPGSATAPGDSQWQATPSHSCLLPGQTPMRANGHEGCSSPNTAGTPGDLFPGSGGGGGGGSAGFGGGSSGNETEPNTAPISRCHGDDLHQPPVSVTHASPGHAQHGAAGSPHPRLRIDASSFGAASTTEDEGELGSPSSGTGSSSSPSASVLADFQASVFKHLLSASQLRRFAALFNLEAYRPGATVCVESELVDRLLVVRTGELALFAKKHPGPTTGPGSPISVAETTAPPPPTGSTSPGTPTGQGLAGPGVGPAGKLRRISSRIDSLNLTGGLGMTAPNSAGPSPRLGGGAHGSPSARASPSPRAPDVPLVLDEDMPYSSSDVGGELSGHGGPASPDWPSHASAKHAPKVPKGCLQLAAITSGHLLGGELLLDDGGTNERDPSASPKSAGLSRSPGSGFHQLHEPLPPGPPKRAFSVVVGPRGASCYSATSEALTTFLAANPSLPLVFRIGLGCGLPGALMRAPASCGLFEHLRPQALRNLWALGRLKAYKADDLLYDEAQRPGQAHESTTEDSNAAAFSLRFICKGSVLLSRLGVAQRGGAIDPAYSGHKYRIRETSSAALDALDVADRTAEAERLQERVKEELEALATGLPTPAPHGARLNVLAHESVFGLEEVLLGLPARHTARTLTPTLVWEIDRRSLVQWCSLQTPITPVAGSSASQIVLNLARHWSALPVQAPSLLLHAHAFQRVFASFLAKERAEENLQFVVYAARFRTLPIHDTIAARKYAALLAAAQNPTEAASLKSAKIVPSPPTSPFIAPECLSSEDPLMCTAMLELRTLAQAIYDQFLHATRSPHQLQIHQVTRARIMHKLKLSHMAPTANGALLSPCSIGFHIDGRLFRDAEYEISDLLLYDSFVRFRNVEGGALFKTALADMLKPTEQGFNSTASLANAVNPPLGAQSHVTSGMFSSASHLLSAPMSPMSRNPPMGSSGFGMQSGGGGGAMTPTRHPFASLLGHAPQPRHGRRSSTSASYQISAVEWRDRDPYVADSGDLFAGPASSGSPAATTVGTILSAAPTFRRFRSASLLKLSSSATGVSAAHAAANEARELETALVDRATRSKRRSGLPAPLAVGGSSATTSAGDSPFGGGPSPSRRMSLVKHGSSPSASPPPSSLPPVFAGAQPLANASEADALVSVARAAVVGTLKRQLLDAVAAKPDQPLFASFQIAGGGAEEPQGVRFPAVVSRNTTT